jgi:hypothetical protein
VPKEVAAGQALQHLETTQMETLSRSSLAELILRPWLNLYPAERQRMPMESVIEQMRRDIEIRRVPSTDAAGLALSVSFVYPDQFKAQAVAQELTSRFVEMCAAVNRKRPTVPIAQSWRLWV